MKGTMDVIIARYGQPAQASTAHHFAHGEAAKDKPKINVPGFQIWDRGMGY